MRHVFVSYSRMNGEAVDQIVAHLEQDSFNVWIDREGIKVGELWHEAIIQAVDNAYAFVLMLSPGSAASDNVRKEVDLAEEAKKESSVARSAYSLISLIKPRDGVITPLIARFV